MALNSFAQEVQIGQWRSYLPYNNAISLAKVDDRIYVATRRKSQDEIGALKLKQKPMKSCLNL
ncbi:hypothetical protein N9Y26_01265 [bacterium]|nr:hypothetical protein [bacterium]